MSQTYPFAGTRKSRTVSKDLRQGISSEMAKFPHRISGVVPDRGPAKYFHGRTQILADFKHLLDRSKRERGGTIFLIKGAPGAGKTALLDQCEKLARRKKWDVVQVGLGALWNSVDLFYDIHNKAGRRWKRWVRNSPPRTVLDILRKRKSPLLLTVDEVQALDHEYIPPPEFEATLREVLDFIHHGKLGRPVILAAAGLGNSADAFRSLGVAEFAETCLVELGALDKKPERAVILDWFKKYARMEEDPSVWIDAIVQQTHGWPVHIIGHVWEAMNQLSADNGVMTEEGLNTVLIKGREWRTRYYWDRARGLDCGLLRIAKPFAEVPSGESVSGTAILNSLTQGYGPDEAKKLFNQALHYGIIDRRKGLYVVPEPAMHDWLVCLLRERKQ